MNKVLTAQKFNQGYATTEYLAAALMDQEWHLITADQAPKPAMWPHSRRPRCVRTASTSPDVPPRYHSEYFSHIFAGGYSSGYYAYLWSEVLARDTGKWMHDHGGLTRANGDYLRDKVLSRGRSRGSADPVPEFLRPGSRHRAVAGVPGAGDELRPRRAAVTPVG